MIPLALLLLLFQVQPQLVYIGSFSYAVAYDSESLGKVSYPLDDDAEFRILTLPTLKGQQPVSIEHEEIHACMHDHSHHFKTRAELEAHLEKQMYSEEEVATILAPCLLELQKVDLRQKALKGKSK